MFRDHCLQTGCVQEFDSLGPREMRMTFKSQLLVVVLLLVLLAGCKRNEQPQTTNPSAATPAVADQASPGAQPAQAGNPASSSSSKAKVDACTLLTTAEIHDVQQESVKETKLSGSTDGGFSVSQCFFTLPTFTNSISLQVTQRGDDSAARDPREFWRDTFHREQKSEKERERDKEKKREKQGKTEEEEEGDGAPPLKISGVGDEAFWVGSRVGGALYVLKGNSYLRVSIGGAGAQKDKIQKSKELAQKVAERL
jgi:hypothetical protein